MLITSIMVIGSLCFFCITHQIVDFNYVQFFVYQSVKKCSLSKLAKAILRSNFLILISKIKKRRKVKDQQSKFPPLKKLKNNKKCNPN